MGIIKRLRRITTARIDTFLDGLENPEAVYPELLNELREQVQVAERAEGKSRAAFLSAQRKVDEIVGRLVRVERGVQQALVLGDDETSRDALAVQLASEKEFEETSALLEDTEKAYEQARGTRLQLQAELTRLKEGKEEILERARSAKTDERSAEQAGGGTSLLQQVTTMAGKLKDMACGDEAIETPLDVESAHLDYRMRQLNRAAEIEKRLDQLRQETSPKA